MVRLLALSSALLVVLTVPSRGVCQNLGQYVRVEMEPPPQLGPDEYVEYTWEVYSVLDAKTDAGTQGGTYSSRAAAVAAAAKWLAENWKLNKPGEWTRFVAMEVKGVAHVRKKPGAVRDQPGPAGGRTVNEPTARLDNRLDKLANRTMQTLEGVMKEKGHDVASVFNRVEKLSSYLGNTVPTLTKDAFSDVNALVKDYNAMANQLGQNAIGGLQTLPGLDSKTFSSLSPELQQGVVQEQILTVKTKFEEAGLRVQQRELEQFKEELEVEAQQIAADKAAGIDVTEREQKLAGAFNNFEQKRDGFQKEVDSYSQDVKKLETTQKQVKEEKQLAERRRLEEERRKKEVAARMAEQRRVDEERVAATTTPNASMDSLVGTWSDRGSSWHFNADGTMSGQARGQWKKTTRGVAIKYSGATAWINLTLKDGRLVDEEGFIGGLHLKKAN